MPTSFFGLLYVGSICMNVSNRAIFADATLISYHTSVKMISLAAALEARWENIIDM
jgi:hypothetical protein